MTHIGGKDLERIAQLTLEDRDWKIHRADPVNRYKTDKNGERQQVSQHDLFKCFDLLALPPDDGQRPRLIQVTTPNSAGERKIKISKHGPWNGVVVLLYVWQPSVDAFEVFMYKNKWTKLSDVDPLTGFQTASAIHKDQENQQ